MAWIPTAFIIPNTVLCLWYGQRVLFRSRAFVSFALFLSFIALGGYYGLLGAHEVHREFALVGPVISGKMSVRCLFGESPILSLAGCPLLSGV